MAYKANIQLIIDVDSEGEAYDFCAETFRGMPFIIDWGHSKDCDGNHTVQEVTVAKDYEEGDLIE